MWQRSGRRIPVFSCIRPLKKRTPERGESGIFLIELLVAIVMAALVTLALFESLSAALRASQAAQMNLTATIIAQEVIDESRNQSWTTLSALPASSTLPVNASQASSTTRPLHVNTDLGFNNLSTAGKFTGTCTRTITDVSPTVKRVTATVTWNEGRSQKTYQATSIVSMNGIHN